MKESKVFSRILSECEKDSRILIDPEIDNSDYVGTFGFEWTKIDGFICNLCSSPVSFSVNRGDLVHLHLEPPLGWVGAASF